MVRWMYQGVRDKFCKSTHRKMFSLSPALPVSVTTCLQIRFEIWYMDASTRSIFIC